MTPSSSIFRSTILKRMLIIMMTSGLMAGAANFIHPRRIPWVQDWGNYVEAKAVQAGIEVVPLSLALSIYEEGTHQFLDARSVSGFETGHIPKALSLPFEQLDDHLHTLEQVLDSDRPLVVYCRNRECDDALLLAMELRDMGQSNLLYYVDGFELWEESGCPVEMKEPRNPIL